VIRTGVLLACGASLVAALALAVGADEGPERVSVGALELQLRVHDTAGEEARRFGAGEAVDLVLEVHNAGEAPLALSFATARRYDFAVMDAAGVELWRWSRGRLFAQVLEEIEMAPGETRRFAASWDKRDSSGTPAPPGHYRVTATLACSPSPPPVGPIELDLD